MEALAPEERDDAPVTKPRHARMLRRAGKLVADGVVRRAGALLARKRVGGLADGDAHVIRRAGALPGGLAGEYDGGIHHW